jgi:hypothetical protein
MFMYLKTVSPSLHILYLSFAAAHPVCADGLSFYYFSNAARLVSGA